MHMKIRPNKHKGISFNTTTMTSLGFIAPPLKFSPSPQIQFFTQALPNYFRLKFLGAPLKLGGLLP